MFVYILSSQIGAQGTTYSQICLKQVVHPQLHKSGQSKWPDRQIKIIPWFFSQSFMMKENLFNERKIILV